MTKRAFDRIAEGLEEAIAITRGTAEPAALHVPDTIDVKGLRGALGLSQGDFAKAYGFSLSQIRDWEQGRCRPAGALRAYLTIIACDPESVRRMLRDAA